MQFSTTCKGEQPFAPPKCGVFFELTGGKNVRYKRGFKDTLVEAFCQLLQEHLPHCTIRYAF